MCLWEREGGRGQPYSFLCLHVSMYACVYTCVNVINWGWPQILGAHVRGRCFEERQRSLGRPMTIVHSNYRWRLGQHVRRGHFEDSGGCTQFTWFTGTRVQILTLLWRCCRTKQEATFRLRVYFFFWDFFSQTSAVVVCMGFYRVPIEQYVWGHICSSMTSSACVGVWHKTWQHATYYYSEYGSVGYSAARVWIVLRD